MNEWKAYKLGEVADVQTGPFGSQLHQSDYVAYGIPSIMPVNIGNRLDIISDKIVYVSEEDADRLKKYRVKEGDIVYSRRGDVEKCAYIGTKENGWLCGTGCLRIRIDMTMAHPRFVAYYLSTEEVKSWISNNAVGTTMPNLNSGILQCVDMLLPPIDEQKRISGVLSSLDDKIDLLHRENATLEALAETLFLHYFIENPNPTWKEGKLGDYVIETIGGDWGTETPEGESGMPVRCLRGADVADLNDGIATRTPLRYVKPSKYEKIKPNNGDIILEISGGTDTCSTGRVAYINEGVKQLFDYPIVFSNFCRLLRVKEDYTYFVYCYFRHLHKQGEFFNLENGSSGIHNLNYKAALYDDLGWPVPTDEKLVIEFGEKVKPYFDKINTNKKQILSLSAQRDTMLPHLMSGEVKVAE